jgi:hypothetical protein
VVGVVLATGVGAVEPGVVEELVDVCQAQPVSCLPEQPGRYAAAPMKPASFARGSMGQQARASTRRSTWISLLSLQAVRQGLTSVTGRTAPVFLATNPSSGLHRLLAAIDAPEA